jgi:hypothetical protein
MSTIDELLSQIPIDQVAAQLGLSEADAEKAVRSALPALVTGMQANAADPAGAESLAKALGQHDGSLLDGGVDLGQVDVDDGQKIVNHVFGDNEEAVADQLSAFGGLDSGMIMKLLPMLAPLLMSFLGKSFGGGGGTAGKIDSGSGSAADATSGLDSGMAPSLDGDDAGGGLGDLLGGLLGGGGGGLGDLLGGLLGKGR